MRGTCERGPHLAAAALQREVRVMTGQAGECHLPVTSRPGRRALTLLSHPGCWALYAWTGKGQRMEVVWSFTLPP